MEAPHTDAETGLLRFLTCGSVDDGKSTLIGRLLYESGQVYEDQLAALAADSSRWGTQGGATDYALLVDGLTAEREQGITIDVAYRHFATPRRRFIVADAPGHVQYTRNMITAASTADAAILLVDARKGVLPQTRRHGHLIALLGVRHVVLAVNKMDLVDWDAACFERIRDEFVAFAAAASLADATAIPLSALRGDNVVAAGMRCPWYRGPTLLQALEACEIDHSRLQRAPLRLPVQWVSRPHQDFRGYGGLVAAGRARPGDRVRLLPSGRETAIARIVGPERDEDAAVAGQSVLVTLADDVDVSRGDVICCADAPAQVADQFECTLVWMDPTPLLPGRAYWLKIGTNTVGASVTSLKHRLDVDTMERVPARELDLNEVAVCNLALDAPVAFDPYRENRETGGFILIDRATCRTVGAGMLHFALRRAHNIHRQHLDVDQAARSVLLRQKPAVVWLTGLSGAGKSTIANALAATLHGQGYATYVLDGDNLRHGLCRDLGFTDADRVENVRRVAEVARLMADAGLIVITAFISPFAAERRMARSLLRPGQFVEVFVDAPLAIAEARDPKGLYAKARRGALPNFTGIDSAYEPPDDPEVRVDTSALSVREACEAVVATLRKLAIVTGESASPAAPV